MTDIHTEHCCIFHGCKYGNDNCTVTTKLAPQSYRCEVCEHVGIDIRPWGYYQVLVDESTHKVKTLTVKAGKRLSLQRHSKRHEHWVCVSGEGFVTLGASLDSVATVGFGGNASKHVDIPQGFIHRVEASPHQDLVFIEIQTGTYFGEDDIERFQDDFGRTS